MISSQQRIAVVTATKGIGFETAKKLLAAGIRTVICGRDEERGMAAAAQASHELLVATSAGAGGGGGRGDIHFRHLDISDRGSVETFVESFGREFGRCDVLVNSAGVAFKASERTLSHEQQARPTFATNYFGTVDLTLAMLPLLRKGKSPRIVTIASKSGQLRILGGDEEKLRRIAGQPPSPVSVAAVTAFAHEYLASAEAGKAAADGWPASHLGMSQLCKIAFTKALARREMAHGLIAHACCPGHCQTDMSSGSGSKTAEEGARTPAWVALMRNDEGRGSSLSLSTGRFFSAEASYTESREGEDPSEVFEIQW
mmetsp:Transcript_16804/g.34225  ORF Transcript_16804/g.34225 Transcript_16804/m.34225 type:complete len:314 (-) Transcript_16804:93-1034(-)